MINYFKFLFIIIIENILIFFVVHFCSGERERYFFIRKDKNFPNNPIRKVGNHSGSWILRKTRRIFDTIGNKIALKFYFAYYSKLGRTRWKMDEFQLPNEFYKNFKVKVQCLNYPVLVNRVKARSA